MERANRVKRRAEDMIESGRKPSVRAISAGLGMPEQDVHRCLNFLEKEGELETYTREVFGKKNRYVALKR